MILLLNEWGYTKGRGENSSQCFLQIPKFSGERSDMIYQIFSLNEKKPHNSPAGECVEYVT
ncbi:hypothetical protein A4S05_10885 [Nostoc sp. KVJ20]|nr:hypothetical protein A4S05_10885 [Nostoc sp. KVJ20]